MFHEAVVDSPRERYSIRVQYFSNGEQRWAKLTIDDKRDRRPPTTVRLTPQQFSRWLKARKQRGEKSLLKLATAQMAAHPDVVKSVAQHGSAIAGSGIGELMKLFLDAN